MTSCDEIAVASTNGIMLVRPESANASAIVANLDLVDCQAVLSDCNRESTVVFAAGRSLLLWDTRTKGPSTILKTSHFFPILACDANPVLENVFVTGAADGRVLFWDIRQPNSTPLEELAAHNHHVTSVKYHPVHDQLLITSGTDCAVKLWRCQSVSSTPSRAYPLSEDSKAAAGASSIADGLLEAFTRHEDSVYNCCWGSEGWSFASVSYDGAVMVNTVPRAEKYRIML
jgi:WD40 repeat protein